MKRFRLSKLYVLMVLLPVLLLMHPAVSAEGSSTVSYAVTGGNIYFDPSTGTITGCDASVTTAVVPSTIQGVRVTAIGDLAFDSRENLTKVVLPDGITSIGFRAFAYNDKLTSLNLPASVTSISSGAFNVSRSLKTVGPVGGGYNIEYGWTQEIPKHAFDCAGGITSIVIRSGITTLGEYCFENAAITSIDIPDSVTTIGAFAFEDCYALQTIHFSDNLTSIGTRAFEGCSKLQQLNLPSGLNTIGDRAFGKCALLSSVYIPASVTSIGNMAFWRCTNLSQFYVDSANNNFKAINGVLFSNSGRRLHSYPTARTGGYTVPDGVTTIGDSAFEDCESITSIRFPYGVTYIENWAFYGCSALNTVYLPGSVTYIGNNGFRSCDGLTTVYYYGTPEQWSAISFGFYNEPIKQASIQYCYHTISVSAGLGGTASASATAAGEGQTITLTATPNSGYHFKQWTVMSGNVTVTDNAFTMGTSDVVIEAEFVEDAYTVTYNANGGSGAPSPQTGSSVTIPSTIPSRFGYNFMGWVASASATSPVNLPGETLSLTSDRTLYVYWRSATAYTQVTSVDTSVKIDIAGAPRYLYIVPSASGTYIFKSGGIYDTVGTLYDASGSQLTTNDDNGESRNFSISYDLSANTGYYLKVALYSNTATSDSFSVRMDRAVTEYTVSYDANGGSGAPSAQTKTHGVALTLSNTVPTRYYAVTFEPCDDIGMTEEQWIAAPFTGWNTEPDGSGTSYAAGGSYTLDASNTLYAQWGSVALGTLSTPTRSGYTFDGWYTSVTGGTRVTSSTYISGNIILYAHWTSAPSSYTVYFNANGGSVSPTSKTVTNGSTYGDLPTPTRSGYTFDGWYTSASSGTKITSSTTVSLTANQTLYAHWTSAPASYTVYFNANGGSVNPTSKTVTNGSTYGDLPTPTRSGYTFGGWYTSASGGTQITSSTTVNLTANQTLYAHWSGNTYTVTFNANGGSVSPTTKTVTNGSTYGDLPTPTRSGYVFSGWYTASSGGTQITSSTTVNLTANQTLYAHWTSYKVTFNANGGEGGPSSLDGVDITIPTDVPTRFGYDFLGWAVSSGSSSPTCVPGDSITLTGNMTFYAVWKSAKLLNRLTLPIASEVNMNIAGAARYIRIIPNNTCMHVLETSGSYDTLGVLYDGDGNQLASNDDGGEGHNFRISYSMVAGNSYYLRVTMYSSTAAPGTIAVTISGASFTVTFNPNGGSVSPTSKTVTNGSTYGDLPTPTLSGYTFGGWYTSASGGTKITSSTTVNLTANQTLYAHWSGNSYTVTFNANGGSVSPTSKTVTNGSTYGDLPTPSWTNHRFDGWYTSSSGGSQVTSTTTVDLTANQTLYAHWTVIQDNSFTWGRDNWNFNNNWDYFSSGRMSTQISQSYLNVLASNLTNTEYYYIFDPDIGWLYDTWGGSCYGMSSLTLLSNRGMFPYSRYKSGATCLNQLNYPLADMNISSLVTYYQLLQVKDVIQQQYRTVPSRSHQENISRIISLLDANDTVLIGFKQKGWGGHAILAYGYEYGSFTWNGVTYQGHIKICDPNSSKNQSNQRDIYFNTSTYSWIIPYYRYGSSTGAVFNYVGANASEINRGGYLNGGSASGVSNYVGRIDVAAASQNRSVVKVVERNGNYVTQTNASDDIVEDYSYISGNESDGMPGYNLFDPDSAYRVSQNDPTELDLRIEYEACALRGHSYAGKNIVFDKKGCVSIHSESADYEMSMTFNEGYPTDWFNIRVSGSNANSVSIEACSEGYILSGDNLENIVAKASNRTDTAQIAFTTEFKSVLLYETESGTLGVMVDTDNDGIFDTDLNSIAMFIVPKALETIDESAFEGCAFTHVVLSNNVTTIGARAFADCPNLVYIEIPQSVTTIADDAFSGSNGVTIVCKQGSAAYAFATAHGISYRTIG